MPTLTARYIYSGMGDYWGGDGDRWDDNKGCLFAYYGKDTTLHDLIDQLVDDFNSGGDCETMPEDITDCDVRAALLEMLTDQGRDDYMNDVVAGCAEDYADANDDEEDDDCSESPIFVVLMECEVCSECKTWCDHYVDDVCETCYEKEDSDVCAEEAGR